MRPYFLGKLGMTVEIVSGDPLQTQAQVLAFGYNAHSRSEVNPLQATLQYRYPAAFAAFGKQCRAGRIAPGTLWIWREAQPWLGFMIVRESSVGPTRLRFVQQIALTLARDYQLDGIRSVAIASLCTPDERAGVHEILMQWLGKINLQVTLYE